MLKLIMVTTFAALLFAVGCSSEGVTQTDTAPTATSTAALTGSADLVIYDSGDRVPDCDLIELGPPEAAGGETLAGNPVIAMRTDWASPDGLQWAGVFQGTAGSVRVHFPFNEHATILAGEVTVTDETTGVSHRFKKGDSYFARQGAVIRYDVKRFFQKSAYNFVTLPSQ